MPGSFACLMFALFASILGSSTSSRVPHIVILAHIDAGSGLILRFGNWNVGSAELVDNN